MGKGALVTAIFHTPHQGIEMIGRVSSECESSDGNRARESEENKRGSRVRVTEGPLSMSKDPINSRTNAISGRVIERNKCAKVIKLTQRIWPERKHLGKWERGRTKPRISDPVSGDIL